MEKKEECKHEWILESCTGDTCIFKCKKCNRIYLEQTVTIDQYQGDFEC